MPSPEQQIQKELDETVANLLGEFEARLGNVVEGTFGAMFRSPVQPAELARAASKEMTRSRKLGLDKMYVANVYFVFISPRDANVIGDLIRTIEGELETYLLAFARERDYSFVTRPIVRFSIDDTFKRLGKFDIVGQQMTAEAIFDELGSVPGVTDDFEQAEEDVPFASHGGFAEKPVAVMPPVDPWADAPEAAAIPVATPPVPAYDFEPELERPATAVVPDAPAVAPLHDSPAAVRVGSVVMPGQGEVELQPNRSYITGRQSTCDLPLSDANMSRQHAELFWDGEGWSIRDLGSTNGTSVNGHRIFEAVELHDSDRITMGVSTIIYHETSGMA